MNFSSLCLPTLTEIYFASSTLEIPGIFQRKANNRPIIVPFLDASSPRLIDCGPNKQFCVHLELDNLVSI